MTAFDRTTTVVFDPSDPDHLDLELSEEWGSLMGAHGGYITALAVRAVEARHPGQAVRTVCTSFLRPIAVGAASMTIDTLRSGRSLSTLVVSLSQNGKAATSTRITTAATVAGADWDHAAPLPVPPVSDCIVVPGPPGIRHLDHGSGVLDPAHLPLTRSEHAVLQGHIRPSEPRPIDTAWLVMVLDFFPPAAWTRVDPPTGGVSVDYTVHIHRALARPLGPDEWLAVSLRSDISTGGLCLEHGAVQSPDGQLLAESFHTRWTG